MREMKFLSAVFSYETAVKILIVLAVVEDLVVVWVVEMVGVVLVCSCILLYIYTNMYCVRSQTLVFVVLFNLLLSLDMAKISKICRFNCIIKQIMQSLPRCMLTYKVLDCGFYLLLSIFFK